MTIVRPSGPVRLVIVDDHLAFADSLGFALERHADFQVVGTASDLDSARRLLDDTIDVVLIDLDLNGQDGLELVAELAELRPALRTLVVTSRADGEALRAALASGATGYVLKSVPLADLVSTIQSVALGQVAVPPSLLADAMAPRSDPPPAEPTVRRGGLTDRELEVLRLLADGVPTSSVAAHMSVSINTVRTHVQNLLAKLDSHTRLEAVSKAIAAGIISSPGSRDAPG